MAVFPDSRAVAVKIVQALLDGPVTEYGLADLIGMKGGDRLNRARAWLRAFNEQNMLDKVGERPNPRGAPAGTHPVYALRRPRT